MKSWVPGAIRAGVDFAVELWKAIRARRAGRRRGATEVLEEHGPLRSTAAKERAHEALEREDPEDER